MEREREGERWRSAVPEMPGGARSDGAYAAAVTAPAWKEACCVRASDGSSRR